MAADWWQLRNGWELVDWSLTVDSGAPDLPNPIGWAPAKRAQFIRGSRDDDAIALALLLLV